MSPASLRRLSTKPLAASSVTLSASLSSPSMSSVSRTRLSRTLAGLSRLGTRPPSPPLEAPPSLPPRGAWWPFLGLSRLLSVCSHTGRCGRLPGPSAGRLPPGPTPGMALSLSLFFLVSLARGGGGGTGDCSPGAGVTGRTVMGGALIRQESHKHTKKSFFGVELRGIFLSQSSFMSL